MKKILFLSMLLPSLMFGQTSRWRTNPPTQNTPQVPQTPQRPQNPTPPPSNTSTWRNNPPAPQRTPQRNYYNTYPQYNRYHPGNPYPPYGYNRWYSWGAPYYGYDYYTNGYYFNRWGYREPYRVYVYDNGKKDTIRGHMPHVSVGIQGTTDNQIGGWFTYGDRGYFIMDVSATFFRDNSTFFPYGNIGIVDFPLTNDFRRVSSLYVGVGKKINRTGFHVMIGTVGENVRYRGYDNYGYITFPKYDTRFMTFKFGVIHDYKNFTFKGDYDPKLVNLTFGAGINF